MEITQKFDEERCTLSFHGWFRGWGKTKIAGLGLTASTLTRAPDAANEARVHIHGPDDRGHACVRELAHEFDNIIGGKVTGNDSHFARCPRNAHS